MVPTFRHMTQMLQHKASFYVLLLYRQNGIYFKVFRSDVQWNKWFSNMQISSSTKCFYSLFSQVWKCCIVIKTGFPCRFIKVATKILSSCKLVGLVNPIDAGGTTHNVPALFQMAISQWKKGLGGLKFLDLSWFIINLQKIKNLVFHSVFWILGNLEDVLTPPPLKLRSKAPHYQG